MRRIFTAIIFLMLTNVSHAQDVVFRQSGGEFPIEQPYMAMADQSVNAIFLGLCDPLGSTHLSVSFLKRGALPKVQTTPEFEGDSFLFIPVFSEIKNGKLEGSKHPDTKLGNEDGFMFANSFKQTPVDYLAGSYSIMGTSSDLAKFKRSLKRSDYLTLFYFVSGETKLQRLDFRLRGSSKAIQQLEKACRG